MGKFAFRIVIMCKKLQIWIMACIMARIVNLVLRKIFFCGVERVDNSIILDTDFALL